MFGFWLRPRHPDTGKPDVPVPITGADLPCPLCGAEMALRAVTHRHAYNAEREMVLVTLCVHCNEWIEVKA